MPLLIPTARSRLHKGARIFSYGVGSEENIISARPAPSKNARCVLTFHEGGWDEQVDVAGVPRPGERITNARPEGMPIRDQARMLNEEGFAVFDVFWRQQTGTSPGWPKEIQDAEAAALFVKENAFYFNGNPNKVAMVGGSAGSHVAFLSSLLLNKAKPGYIVYTAGLSGPMDLLLRAEEAEEEERIENEGGAKAKDGSIRSHIARFMGIAGELSTQETKEVGKKIKAKPAWEALAHELSPPFRIDPTMPKMYYAVGTTGDKTPLAQLTAMRTATANAGQSARFTGREASEGGHGFEFWPSTKAEIYAGIRAA